MMMTRKRAVMIPVILYRMIIATAVVGDGPSTLLAELDEPLLVPPTGAVPLFGWRAERSGRILTNPGLLELSFRFSI